MIFDKDEFDCGIDKEVLKIGEDVEYNDGIVIVVDDMKNGSDNIR